MVDQLVVVATEGAEVDQQLCLCEFAFLVSGGIQSLKPVIDSSVEA